ncbi:MAG: hypothetical protein WC708_09160 [Lentisphaeria bacterium]
MRTPHFTKGMAVFLAYATLLGGTASAVAASRPLGMPPVPLTQNESANLAVREHNSSELAGVRASGNGETFVITFLVVFGILCIIGAAAASSSGGSSG